MAVVVFVLLLAAALAAAATGGGNAAFVEHTFVVSQISVRHLCKDTLVTVVNEQLPGPTIQVNEGDSVTIHVINKSPYELTIHWHGLKQQLNCWGDGAGMITQCPIQPNNNFTYRFNVSGQEGTLWWHAHVACLRETVHGAIVIQPRLGPGSYPFPKPDGEIPIIIGEWKDVETVHKCKFFDIPRTATINGKLGDLYNCSGNIEDNYILNVERGKTFLLRIVNAALHSEYYLKIAAHRFTVVGVDANYVKPYTTDTIAIAPGETIDALVVADAPPGKYYMVALSIQSNKPTKQVPVFTSRGMVQYSPIKGEALSDSPMTPKMPDQHDAIPSFNFHQNLTSLHHHPQFPVNADENLFLALDTGYICEDGASSCDTDLNMWSLINNISFQLPATTSLLEAHYYNKMSSIGTLRELPAKAPRMFNYSSIIEPTSKATSVRWLKYNTTVEIVFQSPVLADSYSNPMHLHGHDFFVLAQGVGEFEMDRDMKTYNLLDPPLKNTVAVPKRGWAAIRFVTKNPGVWFLHCHYEQHSSVGMAMALVVGNGPTPDTILPPPPADYPSCAGRSNNRLAYE